MQGWRHAAGGRGGSFVVRFPVFLKSGFHFYFTETGFIFTLVSVPSEHHRSKFSCADESQLDLSC